MEGQGCSTFSAVIPAVESASKRTKADKESEGSKVMSLIPGQVFQ